MTDRLRPKSFTDEAAYFVRNISRSIYSIDSNVEFIHPLTGWKGLLFELLFTVRVP